MSRPARQTYRQVTHRLRINGHDGIPDRVSERPRAGVRGPFTDDLEAAPTLIELSPDEADIPALLRLGAILPLVPPPDEPVAAPARGGKRG